MRTSTYCDRHAFIPAGFERAAKPAASHFYSGRPGRTNIVCFRPDEPDEVLIAGSCRFNDGNNCRCAVFKISERPGAPQPNALAYFGSTIAPRCRAIFLGAAHVGVGEAQRPAPVLPLYRAPSGDRKFSKIGERGGNRTHDPLIKSQMLYLLSYALSPWLSKAGRAYRVWPRGSTI